MSPSDQSDGPETIVVGLDGAGHRLLRPWLEAGELPNLQSILDDGVSGPLESVLPPVTSPNWKAYSTGKNPGKLGIFWWQNVDTDGERTYLPDERYHDHDEFWELIGKQAPVGVLGVPTTYPPKEVEPFLVAGPPDADEKGHTHPESIERELRREFDYRIMPRYRTGEDPELAYEEWLDLVDLQFEVGKYLLDEHDVEFLQVTTFYINQLHHHLWDDERTLRGWKIIDDHLADLRASGRNLVLMSDHGHSEIETVFRINQWLESEGYLAWDRSVADTLYRLGINTDRLNRLLVRLDRSVPLFTPSDLAARLAPRWLLAHLPNEQGEVGSRTATNVDWDHTDALAAAQGPVYLNVEESSPRYDRLRDELKEKLEGLTGPDGRPVADAVHYGEAVYDGEYVDEGPDLVVDKAPSVNVREHVGDRSVFDDHDDVWDGVNTRSGLFAAVGPAFGDGNVDDISILDLAPTLLAVHGVDVPADMDGRVRRSVLSDDVAEAAPGGTD